MRKWSTTFTMLVLLIAFAGCGGGGTSAPPITGTTAGQFYVATNGNDDWHGTFATPQGSPPTDGPFATVDRARVAAQAISKTSGTPIVVAVRGGVYYQTSLSFAAADSGSSSTPVVYENYLNETPVLTGGRLVRNWSNVGGNQWMTTLPADTVNFEALYYNGVRQTRPRLGSGIMGTYYRVAGQVNGCPTGSGLCYDRFVYNPSDPISSTWQNLSPPPGNPCNASSNSYPSGDIELLIFEYWTVSRQRITCIDTTNHIIYLTGSTQQQISHGYLPNHRYIIENVKDQLTQPGQWFLDRSINGAWTLTYLANAGENPNTDTVVIPQASQVLTANGLLWVSFEGITFAGDNFVASDQGYASDQADRGIPAAVSCNNCSNVTFDTDTFANITGFGLGLVTDNHGTAANNLIQNSAFFDLGAGGITMGHFNDGKETDANVLQSTTVQNNIVQGYGRMYPGAAGILALVSHDLTITHNEISDGYNQGIDVCTPSATLQCAGDVNSGGTFNITVSYNHIWNLGQGITSDFGGVYFATYAALGNKVLNNKVHDISDASALDADGYGGQGIYFDRGGPFDVENNLVYRISASNVFSTLGPQVAGQVITYKNNVLAFGKHSIVGMGKCASLTNLPQFVFENNVVYQDKTSASVQAGSSYLGPNNSFQTFSKNMYWNTAEDLTTVSNAFHSQSTDCSVTTPYAFPDWQATAGEDAGSVVQNPGFKSPGCNQSTAVDCAADSTQDDYSLTASTPIGFKTFSTSGACDTCPGRTAPAITPATVPATFTAQPYNPATDF